MLKLNRYLLVALSIVAVNMGPMQVQAKNTTPKANERKTNRNQEDQVKDFDRVKREIDIKLAKELLTNERRGVIAVNGDDGYPYAVPINYLYVEEENKIYFRRY